MNTQVGYSSHQEFLETQPIFQMDQPPYHAHTKSHDLSFMPQFSYVNVPYMYSMFQSHYHRMPMQYQYYQPQMYESPPSLWDQSSSMPVPDPYYAPHPPSQFSPADQSYMCFPPGKKKGLRKRNAEKEEEKGNFMIDLESILLKKDMRTTLMIKNVPNKYTQKLLLQDIDKNHRRQYDFFYLPIDIQVSMFLIS